jgi:hypothetical protein
MNKEKFLSLVKDPRQTDKQDTRMLSDLVNTYPFFQTAHLLLLHSLKEQKDENFDQQLRESALFVYNRKVLFNLLYGLKATKPLPSDPSGLLEIDETNPITSTDMEKPKIVEFDSPIAYTTKKYIASGMAFELEENGTINNEKAEVPPSSGIDLIEKFIGENPAFIPNRLNLNDQHDDISLDSVQENEELATETLATIYTSQKHYDKAISIYEKLILKFPEKSAYFALRIDELRNSIK